jgi:hypothetical protein
MLLPQSWPSSSMAARGIAPESNTLYDAAASPEPDSDTHALAAPSVMRSDATGVRAHPSERCHWRTRTSIGAVGCSLTPHLNPIRMLGRAGPARGICSYAAAGVVVAAYAAMLVVVVVAGCCGFCSSKCCCCCSCAVAVQICHCLTFAACGLLMCFWYAGMLLLMLLLLMLLLRLLCCYAAAAALAVAFAAVAACCCCAAFAAAAADAFGDAATSVLLLLSTFWTLLCFACLHPSCAVRRPLTLQPYTWSSSWPARQCLPPGLHEP